MTHPSKTEKDEFANGAEVRYIVLVNYQHEEMPRIHLKNRKRVIARKERPKQSRTQLRRPRLLHCARNDGSIFEMGSSISIALMISTFSQAQDYKPLRVGLGIGFAIPSPIGGNNTTGGLIYLESSYRVSDALAVGLKIEAAIMAIQGSTAFAGLSAPGSGSLNGQYYFSNKSFRPFVGLGLGLYSDIASWPEKTYQFGLYPRIGFDAAHFTFNIDYNAVASPASVAKYSYLGIRAGFFIGGGKQ